MRLAVAHTIEWDRFLLLDAPAGEAPTLLGELSRSELRWLHEELTRQLGGKDVVSVLERRCERLQRQLRAAKGLK